MTVIERPFTNPTPEAIRRFVESVPLYRDDDDPTFWSVDRIVARQSELLQRQVGWLAEASAFYQKRFADRGIDHAAICTPDDLAELPVTTKSELMADADAFRLHFEKPTIYDNTYHVVYTSGTTSGRPTRYEYTSHDFLGVLLAGRRHAKTSYQLPGDLYLNAAPLSPLPHITMFGALMPSLNEVQFLHGLSGTPYEEFPVQRPAARLLDMIERHRPQVLFGINSFLRRLFAVAATEGTDLSSLVIVSSGGEVLTERMRDHMHRNLATCGATETFIANPYGFTEGALAWAPCREGGPLHNTAPDQIFMEIIDAETHRPVPDGDVGLVAVTHLNRRGMPLVRYLPGDLAAMTNETCPDCGRSGGSLLVSQGSAHVTRTKDILKVKGTLLNPAVVHDVVMNMHGVLEYQMVIRNQIGDDPLSPDELVIRIALDPADRSERHTEEVARSTAAAIFNATEIRPQVELVDDPANIYDPSTEFKASRVLDERPPLE